MASLGISDGNGGNCIYFDSILLCTPFISLKLNINYVFSDNLSFCLGFKNIEQIVYHGIQTNKNSLCRITPLEDAAFSFSISSKCRISTYSI